MESDRYEDKLDFESEFKRKCVINTTSTTHERVVYRCPYCSNEQSVKLFAMTLKPGRLGQITGSISRADVVPFCRGEKILGAGWGYELDEDPETRAEALKLLHDCPDFDPSGQTPRRWKDFIIWLSQDDIVYVYDKPSGQYWQVMIDSGWKFTTNSGLSDNKQEEFIDHDIWHYRDATWKSISLKGIHGSTQPSVPPHATIQKIHSEKGSIEYAVDRFFGSEISEEIDFRELGEVLARLSDIELIDVLHDNEVEDVVIQYVQRKEDVVFVNRTRQSNQPDVECLLRRVGGDNEPYNIGLQVKAGGGLAGDEVRRLENFLNSHEKLYTYTEDGSEVPGGTVITDAQLSSYIRDYLPELPPYVINRYRRLSAGS